MTVPHHSEPAREAVAELLSHLKLYVEEKLEPDDANMLHDRMHDLTAALASPAATSAETQDDLVSRAEVIRVIRTLGDQDADLALYGAADNARAREYGEAAATRACCAIVLMPRAIASPAETQGGDGVRELLAGLSDFDHMMACHVGIGYFDGTEITKEWDRLVRPAMDRLKSQLAPSTSAATRGEPVAWRYRPDEKAMWNYCEGPHHPRGRGAEIVEALHPAPRRNDRG